MLRPKQNFNKILLCPFGLFISAVAAFLYAPLFLLNSADKGQSPYSMATVGIILGVCLLLLIFSWLLQKFLPKTSLIFDNFMCGVAMYLLVTVFFFPVQTGIMDGRVVSISSWERFSHLGLFGLCLVLALLSLSRKSSNLLYRKIVLILGALSLVLGIYMGASALPWAGSGSELKAQWEKSTGLSPQDNIIIISLDMVQQDFAKRYFDSAPQARNAFDGFVFFTNTASAAPSTVLSFSSLIRGSVFTGDARSVDPQNNLYNDLKRAGYEISSPNVVARLVKGGSIKVSTFPTPPPLRVAPCADALSLALTGINRYLPFNIALSGLEKEFGWGSKLDERNKFLGMIDLLHIDKSVEKHFMLFHTLQTHAPVRFTKDGRYSADLSPDDVHDELIDAFAVVEKCLNKLKSLGIYDDSLVFVISDHGSAALRSMKRLDDSQRYLLAKSGDSEETIYIGQYQPLIMVKPPQAHGALRYAESAATLLDLRKTINEFIHPGAAAELYGVNLLDFENNPRERTVPFLKFTGKERTTDDFATTQNWKPGELRLPLSKNYH